MNTGEWFDLFRSNSNKKIFSLNDLKVLSGENPGTISVQLSRLSRKGMLKNPVKGWYFNPFALPTSEEFSMVLRAPSYLSMEYALSKHGILSQDVHTYTLITTKLPYTYTSENDIFEYHQIKSNLFFGYRVENRVQIAEPEKALVDLVYIRYSRNRERNGAAVLSLIDDMYIEELNKDLILEYSKVFSADTMEFVMKLLD